MSLFVVSWKIDNLCSFDLWLMRRKGEKCKCPKLPNNCPPRENVTFSKLFFFFRKLKKWPNSAVKNKLNNSLPPSWKQENFCSRGGVIIRQLRVCVFLLFVSGKSHGKKLFRTCSFLGSQNSKMIRFFFVEDLKWRNFFCEAADHDFDSSVIFSKWN